MENITACWEQLKVLRCRAEAQIDGLGVLERAFAQEVERLCRQDQARHLDALRVRVMQEMDHAEQMETAASSGFSKGKLICGLAKFALGGLGAALHNSEHPLAIGAKLAANELSRQAPFGKVMVAVGPAGIPDDVCVISVSEYAREQGRTESEILAAIEQKGRQLITLESFLSALERLKVKVLNGSLNLPFTSPLSLPR